MPPPAKENDFREGSAGLECLFLHQAAGCKPMEGDDLGSSTIVSHQKSPSYRRQTLEQNHNANRSCLPDTNYWSQVKVGEQKQLAEALCLTFVSIQNIQFHSWILEAILNPSQTSQSSSTKNTLASTSLIKHALKMMILLSSRCALSPLHRNSTFPGPISYWLEYRCVKCHCQEHCSRIP